MSSKLQRAISFTIDAGYQLDKQAFDFLSTLSQTEDPVRLMEEVIKRIEALPQKTLFIQRSFLEEILERTFKEGKEEKLGSLESPSPIPRARKAFHAYAEDAKAEIEVIQDPTDEICETGSIEEYLKCFQDRFKRTQKLLRRRIDVRDATSITEALKSSANTKVKIICMITEKRERKQRVFLTVEDLETNATVLASQKTNEAVIKKARMLLLDQTVCICAIRGRNSMFIAEDIIWPDIPQRQAHKASVPVYAALISDLHIGSKAFMREEFSRFVLWLNGKFGNEDLKDIASHVKYVVIAGDLVEGIGIYPRQIEDLAITDIYEQYRMVSKFFEQIPDYIELIIIPGNHDVSRKALPQPAMPRDYVEALYEGRQVHSLGNPSSVRLHEVELLLYHGRSLEDVIASIPNVSFQTPGIAMKLLLQSRHLAPTYGKKTYMAPEKRDFMIIERPPDIFHSGHMHVIKVDNYRGTLIVNSGAWQRQTEFQRKMGIVPNPGIAPIVNLQTLQVTPIDFTASSTQTHIASS
ncbi:MAG: DNA-directed DNA polymerase II small subunit [Candidatus Bathyarchaeota archaeon]|nr:MAG: DNA-directed DNA polymerase II small subunit [Candidatus Bathyarchaeota archaeon]